MAGHHNSVPAMTPMPEKSDNYFVVILSDRVLTKVTSSYIQIN